MSDTDVHTALTLEDLFLSKEFGRPRNGSAVAAGAPSLFRSAPPRGPLVPRAATAVSGLVGHDTTSHLRRNRAYAAVSGVAAALLVAVGIVAHTTAPSSNLGTAALKSPGIGVLVPTAGGATTPAPITSTVPAAGTGSGNAAVGLAAFTTGGHTGTGVRLGTSPVPVTVTTKPKGTGTGTTGTKPGSPAPAPAAPLGSALAPVTTLVGNVVTTVGNTSTTLGNGLGGTLPPLAGVTNAVSSLGGGLASLGHMLGGTLI